MTASLHSGNKSSDTVPLTYHVHLEAFPDGLVLGAAPFIPQDEKATSFDLIFPKHFECHSRTHGAFIDLTCFGTFPLKSSELLHVDTFGVC